MKRTMRAFLILRLLTIATITTSIGSCNGNLGVPCKQSEKQALLIFKQDLIDPSNRLSSWVAEEHSNCCNWAGVVCHYSTGHIHELHLDNPDYLVDSNSSLGGKINPSLLNLTHLTYFNLSNNNFQGTKIPGFFGSLNSLTHLDLSQASFGGMVPHQLGNLSSLSHLFLGGDGQKVENMQWISGLSQLEHLDMSEVDLSKASDHWLLVTNMLPSLVELSMSGCQLHSIPLLPIINFTSLAILDLSWNRFNSLMPGWVFSLRNLVSLHLEGCKFQGPIPSSPHNITSLREIDLFMNDFSRSIPEWLFNHKDLTLLELGFNALEGSLPDGMANMTGLKILNLDGNRFNSTIPEWLYSFNYLESLSLSVNNFQGEISSSIGNLTSIISLELGLNLLEGKIPKSLGNLCELMVLDLSWNHITVGRFSEIFETLSACGSNRIKSLSFSSCNISGQLTEQVGTFTNLSSLDLSNNSISGPIPVSLANLSRLETLDISRNQFNGTVPESIGQLKMLTILDMSYNSLEGAVSEVHFSCLTRLLDINGNKNSLMLNTSRDWIPPFQLQYLRLDSWHIGPEFPTWIQRQVQLKGVSLSSTGLSGTIPNWVWHSSLGSLDLSHNQLHGEIQSLVASQLSIIDLSSNQFNGSLPLVSSNVSILDLSNSSFSGSVTHFFCEGPNKKLELLYLGNNHLVGRIPNCWMNWKSLKFVNLESNKLTGNIPSSMGYLQGLISLHLRNNQLSGELPLSLQKCTKLRVVDLGLNKFEGSLPTWMGKSLPNLGVLNLRSNKLQGDIPHELCNLTSLQILDIAHNNLSGTIPRCFNSLAMNTVSKSFFLVLSTLRQDTFDWWVKEFTFGGKYSDNAVLVTKGREVEYSSILGLVTSIDLSNNIISGGIPEELTSLFGLHTLNLSNNLLTGRIPSKIGNLGQLESLDLSKNHLFGEIPTSMTKMTFLSRLNLSYNNLTGRIPESTQLQTLDQSSFVGNELCGPPLIKNCSASKVTPPTVEQQRGYDLLDDKWFYLSLGLGFAVGFWSILGSLLINMPWSFAFSQFLNSIVLKIYALIVEYV
ncbi:receptor-like protein EIX1 [Rosa rugosa]|uniref:receptor-like protein EIX1 n=1 Tax=Rosa rugosa TaxID=74645 RepID=UPI002B40F129|nr:receptor-like protein EIX1 [Rosa rugosa]